MMGVVNGIINDGVKVFGSGGRLYPGADPSDKPAPVEPSAPKPVVQERPAKQRRRKNWRDVGSTVLELTGISAVSFGAYQIYVPAGWITAGVALTVLGVAMGVDR